MHCSPTTSIPGLLFHACQLTFLPPGTRHLLLHGLPRLDYILLNRSIYVMKSGECAWPGRRFRSRGAIITFPPCVLNVSMYGAFCSSSMPHLRVSCCWMNQNLSLKSITGVETHIQWHTVHSSHPFCWVTCTFLVFAGFSKATI